MLQKLNVSILFCCLLSAPAFAETPDWWAASAAQVEKANCQYENGSSAAARKLFLNSFYQNRGQEYLDAEVFGVQLRQESPEFIYKFMQLSRRVDANGRPDAKGQTNLLKQYPRLANCTKVQCALAVMFGPEVAERMLYLIVKYDFNTSALAYPNSSPLTAPELDSILFALDRVPPFLAKLGLNQKLVRFLKGYTYADYDPSVVANATIEFFDEWSKLSPAERSQAVYHELAHNWSLSLGYSNLDESKAWLQLSGWVGSRSGNWTHAPLAGFASRYAMTNPQEDFAETALAYRFNSEWLKSELPGKYEFMKKMVYGGNEFGRGSACERESIYGTEVRDQVRKGLSSDRFKAQMGRVVNLCRKSYADSLLTPIKTNLFHECVQGAAGQMLNSPLKALFAETVPRYLFDPYFKRLDLGDFSPSTALLNLFDLDFHNFCGKGFGEIQDMLREDDRRLGLHPQVESFTDLSVAQAGQRLCPQQRK